MRSQDALTRLRHLPTSLARAALSSAPDPERVLPNLLSLPDQLGPNDGKPLRSSMSTDEAKRRWQDSDWSLDGLEPRALMALCLDTETATSPRFLQGCRSHPKLLQRQRCVLALVNSYFEKWRTMPDPEAMEKMLHAVITGGHCWGKSMDRYAKQATVLFSARSAEMLARNLVELGRPIDKELSEWGVSATGGLPSAVADEAVQIWIDRWSRMAGRGGNQRLEEGLEYGLNVLLSDYRVGRAFYSAMSVIILDPVVQGNEGLQKLVERFVIASPRLGDPRLPLYGPNWRKMSAQAGRIVLAWLARRFTKFFFDFILPPRGDRHGRKPFWLDYAGKFVDFQVVLCREDEHRLRARVEEIPHYAVVTQGDTSAFLMKFSGHGGDIVIAEFSKTGNAAYIHDASAFERTIGHFHQPEFRIADGLKHGDLERRILHMPVPGWQFKAASRLASLGIRP